MIRLRDTKSNFLQRCISSQTCTAESPDGTDTEHSQTAMGSVKAGGTRRSGSTFSPRMSSNNPSTIAEKEQNFREPLFWCCGANYCLVCMLKFHQDHKSLVHSLSGSSCCQHNQDMAYTNSNFIWSFTPLSLLVKSTAP